MEIKDKIIAERDLSEKNDKNTQFKNSQLKEPNEKKQKDYFSVDEEILKIIEDISSTFSDDISRYYNKDDMKKKIEEFCKENSEN